jgi:hypothetical protein
LSAPDPSALFDKIIGDFRTGLRDNSYAEGAT